MQQAKAGWVDGRGLSMMAIMRELTDGEKRRVRELQMGMTVDRQEVLPGRTNLIAYWPEGQSAAVSLKFDDGFESHRTEAAPLLESHGVRGTFYLCPAGTEQEWLDRANRWRPVLDAGHEIGNHTMMHPLPVALAGGPDPRCYEQLTIEAYQADVLEAQRRLELAFGPREWSFCYPCYQTWVGVGKNRRSVVPFIAAHFAAACAGGEISKPYNPPEHCDLHALLSLRAEGLTGDELIAKVEAARELKRWAILTFHGIDEGHLAVGRGDLRKLLVYLDRHRDTIWTAPVIDVALYVRSTRPGDRDTSGGGLVP